ncbi:tRNA pseudouridine synthase A [Robbsia andropogonis]|uniref:tRNA pseudouridine synthase A n=1 Tax=Robbsia andropogonis TaxID=28092 RepID=A0A0F5K3K2_9BURK|nr:tRNA pseudouridine synthase A [Robbsia andropogonis]
MVRIAAGVEYDGSRFHGWQSQPNRETVQGAVEAALSTFTQAPVKVTTAGRTDTGVHALNQVIHFDSAARRSDFSWVRGVNAHLPPGVAIQWAKPVPETFNARFSAFERSYDYVIFQHAVKPTLLAGRVGWVHTPLDVAAMRAAATRLLGEHDFSSFRSSECQAKSPIKTMKQADVVQHGDFIHFRFTASAFLHHMVRNLVGSLVAIGRGRYAPEWVDELLVVRNRQCAAPTFMPDGLYLTRVGYPAEFEMPAPSVAARPGAWRWPD